MRRGGCDAIGSGVSLLIMRRGCSGLITRDQLKATLLSLTALPIVLGCAAPAWAQDAGAGSDIPIPVNAAPALADAAPELDPAIEFSSDALEYDQGRDVVTASGRVRMVREGNRLGADRVIWNRVTGEVRAEGNVSVTNPGGDTAYGDSVRLTDTLRDGAVENLLLVLEDGGRLAAIRATRVNDVTTLERAAYSPCAVVDSEGCPKDPTWQITAVRVRHDPVTDRISYSGARLSVLGIPLLPLPAFSHPDGSGGSAGGLLVPDFRFSRTNGIEFALPYHFPLAPNRDLTITPHVYTKVLPALEGRYRLLNEIGAVQLGGFVTYGTRNAVNTLDPDRGFRGYFEANGRAQLDSLWSITAATRVTTDKTFLRRYDISRDDRLRTLINVERIATDSYVSIAGWAFQGLRATDRQGLTPIALPAIDARLRLTDPWVGGRVELQANSLSILRTDGQDTQRAFAGARWDLRRLTTMGQEVVFTAYGRADAYHTGDTESTATLIYRGDPGFQFRAVGALAADVRWPLIGEFLGGTQRITPRVQIVATPPTRNLSIPNEDSRSVDLETSNLFSLNRFPGYDRWEDGSRVTYGLEYALDRANVSLRTIVGKSYRLNRRPSIFPEGTGLTDRHSDIVGRTELEVGTFVDLTHRFRLDKDNLAVRRNEVDLTLGTRSTYATIGYLRLDRDISLAVEDLRDREEVRLGGRVKIGPYWSAFGSTVIDLTDEREDLLSQADGYEPVRHRIGVAYDDDCLELGITWRRDYERFGDARQGNTFLFRLALKNLGR